MRSDPQRLSALVLLLAAGALAVYSIALSPAGNLAIAAVTSGLAFVLGVFAVLRFARR